MSKPSSRKSGPKNKGYPVIKPLPLLIKYCRDIRITYHQCVQLMNFRGDIGAQEYKEREQKIKAQRIVAKINLLLEMKAQRVQSWILELKELGAQICNSSQGTIDIEIAHHELDTNVFACINENTTPETLQWHFKGRETNCFYFMNEGEKEVCHGV
jgi:hypothetical protein